ncbi:MAG: RdgB/HAM1 family non-canonical purine NTP pyrophosphatase [Candidatus Nanopelagicales bacterium]
MSKVVLASRNQKKIVEVRRILAEVGSSIELFGLDDLDVDVVDVPETGATFMENALIKARSVVEQTGFAALADDSGLIVDALNGMPGVLSARWAGSHGDDVANLELVLNQIGDVPDDRRGGGFVCAVALVRPDGAVVEAEGIVRGRLLREPVGENGFGYDPIFVPDGYTVTTAQMSATEKDSLSHRGRALRALAAQL